MTRFVLDCLPIVVEDQPPGHGMGLILSIGRENGLSSYDTAYLELAMRRGLQLASRDKTLLSACRKVGVKVFR